MSYVTFEERRKCQFMSWKSLLRTKFRNQIVTMSSILDMV